MVSRASLGGSLALLGLALQLAGCTTRTLPLPPPDVDPLVAPDAEGLVLVKGHAEEGASVGVLNEATLQGLIVTSPDTGCDQSCRFQAQIAAHSGDSIRVWQFFETPAPRMLSVPK